MVQVGAPGFPLRVFAFIGLLAVVNSALINMLMASRLLYGMANERILPRAFGTVHPFRRTPWVSILVTTAIAAILVAIAGATGSPGSAARPRCCCWSCSPSSTSPCWCCAGRPSRTALPGADLGAGAGRGAVRVPGRSGAVRPAGDGLLHRRGLLLVGLVLWVINRLIVGKVEFDPQKLTKAD